MNACWLIQTAGRANGENRCRAKLLMSMDRSARETLVSMVTLCCNNGFLSSFAVTNKASGADSYWFTVVFFLLFAINSIAVDTDKYCLKFTLTHSVTVRLKTVCASFQRQRKNRIDTGIIVQVLDINKNHSHIQYVFFCGFEQIHWILSIFIAAIA